MTAKIYHADLYGTRLAKYAALAASDMESIAWQELAPNAPYYLFMPQEQAYREEYEAGWSVSEIFPVNSMGITSGDAKQFVAFATEELENRLPEAEHWHITKVAYRPFDTRTLYNNPDVLARARFDFMRHLHHQENRALATVRRPRNEEMNNFFVSNHISGKEFVSSLDNTQLFPLWLYPTEQEAAMGMEREPNLASAFLTALTARVGETPTPEDVFHYAYAVFHAPTYRTRYAAFLKTDFPRLPLPPDAETFHALAALGAKLTALHLLEAPELTRHGIGFPVGGSHVVQKMRREERYVPPAQEDRPDGSGTHPGAASRATPPETGGGGATAPHSRTSSASGEVASLSEPEGVLPGGPVPAGGRVRLNDAEYFEGVPAEAWNFRVGGYQPAFKWLDDRKGRALTEDDITHYRRMLAAMRETAALLPPVDAAFLRMLNSNAVADEDDIEDTPC